jgi:hypothetical protein
LIVVKPNPARRPNNGGNSRCVMSELAVVLLFAAFIAPPSAPNADGRQPAPGPQTAVVSGPATSAGGAASVTSESPRKGKGSDYARRDVKCPAAAPDAVK